jgi:hypothetical protein
MISSMRFQKNVEKTWKNVEKTWKKRGNSTAEAL